MSEYIRERDARARKGAVYMCVCERESERERERERETARSTDEQKRFCAAPVVVEDLEAVDVEHADDGVLAVLTERLAHLDRLVDATHDP